MKGTTSKNVFDFDQLYEDIAVEHFTYLDEQDNRRSNKSITISDALKSAFAVYSLKAPSLLDFRPKAPAEEENLKACFNIDEIPSDSGLKKLLDQVDSQQLRGVFPKVLQYLNKHKVLDALYGCAPVIKLITQSSLKWKYVINAKPGGHKHLFEQFDERNEKGEVRWRTLRRKEGTYEIGYTSELELNASNKEVKTNMVLLNYRPKKGKVVTFSWMTNMTVNADTVMAITQIGRSRWKIENEVFNTLKNQDYNFNHNFGHGQQHLATNFAYLMMLVFTIDQLRQYGSRVFRSIWKGVKTKKATWDAIRTVFKMVTCASIDDLCHKLLDIYALRMIRI